MNTVYRIQLPLKTRDIVRVPVRLSSTQRGSARRKYAIRASVNNIFFFFIKIFVTVWGTTCCIHLSGLLHPCLWKKVTPRLSPDSTRAGQSHRRGCWKNSNRHRETVFPFIHRSLIYTFTKRGVLDENWKLHHPILDNPCFNIARSHWFPQRPD